MASERKFINNVSKSRLQLLFLDNRPRIENGQKGSGKLGLVDWRPKGLSNKVYLNIPRVRDVRQVKAGPNIKRDNKVGIRRDNKVGIGRDNKADTEGQDNKAGIRRDNKASKGRQDDKTGIGKDNKAGTRRQNNNGMGNLAQNNKADIGRQDNKMGPDNKKAIQPAVRACCTKAQRLLCCAFLLATYSNLFFTFSFSESVIC